MEISKMTDDELRIAIAEALGYLQLPPIGGNSEDPIKSIWDDKGNLCYLPYWPRSWHAAGELMEGMVGDFRLIKSIKVWSCDYEADAGTFETSWCVSGPRAISEAVLAALRSRDK